MISSVYIFCAFQLSSDLVNVSTDDTIINKIPSNFPPPNVNVTITKGGFDLGEELFFEPRLSITQQVACSNCHRASAAFADLNTRVSTGVSDRKGKRNTLPLFNLLWQTSYMWDGRVNDMKLSPINALTNHDEMGTSLEEAVSNLKSLPEYAQLFKDTFGDTEPTEERILDALMQFTATMISANSKYDKVMRNEENTVFNENEQAGYLLFQQKCSSCHKEPLFTDGTFRNNGLELKSNDIGRDTLNHDGSETGRFRVPSLRNIEITAPYMHDGRFTTLKEVLQHYSTGIQNHKNLDETFIENGTRGITLTTMDQTKIIAFLKTLTDIEFINDKRFNKH